MQVQEEKYYPEDTDKDYKETQDEEEEEEEFLVESENPLFTVEEADETNSSDDKKKTKKNKIKISPENVCMVENSYFCKKL